MHDVVSFKIMAPLPRYALVVVALACAVRTGDGFAGPAARGVASGRHRGVTLREARARVAQSSSLPLSPPPRVHAVRRRTGLVRMATEQENAEATKEGAVDGGSGEAPELGNDKVVYDKRTGRFFEKKIEEICREEYCAIDETTGEPMLLTTGEKERIFMDAIQSFYYNERQVLTDDDFDKLKEDLSWEGSKVILMNREEQLFLSAMAAYGRGEKIISDTEFDDLKSKLREAGSAVAVSTEPKCYIDSGICTVTFQEDRLRRYATYLPATFIFGLAFLGISWEVLYPIRYLNPLFTLVLLTYPTIMASKKFTDLCLYQGDGTIAYGPCPSCNAQNRVFFGDILGVEGERTNIETKCTNCGEVIKIQRKDLRARTLPKF